MLGMLCVEQMEKAMLAQEIASCISKVYTAVGLFASSGVPQAATRTSFCEDLVEVTNGFVVGPCAAGRKRSCVY